MNSKRLSLACLLIACSTIVGISLAQDETPKASTKPADNQDPKPAGAAKTDAAKAVDKEEKKEEKKPPAPPSPPKKIPFHLRK